MTNHQLMLLEKQIVPNKQTQLISIDTLLLQDMISALRRDHDQMQRIEHLELELDQLESEYEGLQDFDSHCEGCNC